MHDLMLGYLCVYQYLYILLPRLNLSSSAVSFDHALNHILTSRITL
jgi:hypothetical protein